MLVKYGPVAIAVNASGDATVYLGRKITGRLVALKYTPGTLDTAADLTITSETTVQAILTKENAGTSVLWFYPRCFPNKVVDGSAFTDAAEFIWLYQERIKVVVAQGGVSLAGSIEAYVDQN